MTRNYYKTGNYKTGHSTFSGEIDIEDFNTSKPNKKRISNQIDAINFDLSVKNKIQEKEKEKKYKNMTLEELKELRLISNTNGRPNSSMTDIKWQEEFKIRKLLTNPYSKNIKTMKGKYSKESGVWNVEANGEYQGCTSWQSYCSYINDILRNIRAGQIDYCYYIYQIVDLLKFHHDDLRTKYCDGYWEVWLEK